MGRPRLQDEGVTLRRLNDTGPDNRFEELRRRNELNRESSCTIFCTEKIPSPALLLGEAHFWKQFSCLPLQFNPSYIVFLLCFY